MERAITDSLPRSYSEVMHKWFKKGLVLSVLALSLSVGLAARERIVSLPIPKWQESRHSPMSPPIFLTSGIPLAKGEVSSVQELLLEDSAGERVPAQFTPLAYWPDRSLKWVSISPVLQPGVSLPLALYRGESGQQSVQNSKELEVSQTRSEVVVENRLIRIRVGGNGGGFSVESKASGDAANVDWHLERVLRKPRKVRSGWLAKRSDIQGKPITSYTIEKDKNRVVEIEENGPVRVVIRVRGNFISATGESFCRYDYRIYVYAGSSTVRWQPTWIFDGNPETDSVSRMEAVYRFKRDLNGSAIVGIETDQGDRKNFSLKDGNYLVQEDGHRLHSGQWQENGRLRGWLAIQQNLTSQVRLNVAVREFWQNYPSGFKLAGNSLIVGLWPSFSASVLDLARTSDGTGNGESAVDAKADATGVGKTFDMLLDVEMDPGVFGEVAEIFNQEPLFYPGSQYMAQTGVLGPIAPLNVEKFPRTEGMIRALMYWLLANRNEFNWYGFIDYGDVRTNTVRDEWRKDGRYGWRQGAGDVPNAIMIQYFRTGDSKVWELGAPYARHVLDIDTVHHARAASGQPVGAMHRRGQDHWSGMVQSPYTYTQGTFLYSYLSGDLRARSVLLEEVAPWQSTPEQAFSSNAMNTVIRAWEASGEDKWRLLAQQQFQPHRGGQSYHHFRFAADFVPALAQYAWLTGDEEAWQEVRERGEWLLDAQQWAYFNPNIHPRGGRFLLPALLYWQSGESVPYVKYPARLWATLLPPLPPEEMSLATLNEYRRKIAPTGVTETTQISDYGYIPYFMAALQDMGLGEKEIDEQPALYGVGDGVMTVGTYSNVGQPTTDQQGAWQMISLNAVDVMGTGSAGLAMNEETDTSGLLRRMQGLPFGAVLYVNGIPFHLQVNSQAEVPSLLFLHNGKNAFISMPEGAKGLYLLGPMLESADFREGAEVVKYVLHLRNGGVREGIWKNLTDVNDYRGFHYATGSEPGRFWQTGNEPRSHLSVAYLDFGTDTVDRVELIDSKEGYRSFVVAATAVLPAKVEPECLAEVLFTSENLNSSVDQDSPQSPKQTTTVENQPSDKDSVRDSIDPSKSVRAQNRYLFSKETAADGKEGAAWLISAQELRKITFGEDSVISNGSLGLQIPLANGKYLVEMDIRNRHAWGGAVAIQVSGNRLSGFGLSGGVGDGLQIPARVENGHLQIMVRALPGLLSHPYQRAEWELRAVRVYPLPQGDWGFQKSAPLVVLEGELLGRYAKLQKSVGNRDLYQTRGVENVISPTGEYRLHYAEYPQDIIFVFDKPIQMSGVVFASLAGHGPTAMSLQIKKVHEKQWRTVKEWTLESDHPGIREAIKESGVKEVRFLMHGGHAKHLRLLEANIYGTR